jgi:hypothetical protein
MQKSAIQFWKSTFGSRRSFAGVGLFLATALAAACSVDVSKLRVSNGRNQDAASVAQPPSDAAPSDSQPPLWPDAGSEARPDASEDLATGTDAPSSFDQTRGLEGGANDAGRDWGSETGGNDGDETGGIGENPDGEGDMADTADNATDDGGVAGDLDGNPDTGASTDEATDGDATGGNVEDVGDDEGGAASADTRDVGLDNAGDAPYTGDVGGDGGGDADTPPVLDPDLVLWYRFDESSGTIAHDSARFGGVARDATLATLGTGSSATFSATMKVGTHALALSPANSYSTGGGYVVIPALNTVAPQAVTFAVWVNLAAATSNQNWTRIFDFGDSTTAPNWLNLAARNGSSPYGPVFNMSNTGHDTADQQRLIGSTVLTANVWHHIAVVLPAGTTFTGVMYVDGEAVATNNAMTVHLSDIGATSNNWLGRSQFTTDPYFSGSLDDFRVYKRALSQQEILDLMAFR